MTVLMENTGEEPSLYKVIEQKAAGADQQGMMGTSHMYVAIVFDSTCQFPNFFEHRATLRSCPQDISEPCCLSGPAAYNISD